MVLNGDLNGVLSNVVDNVSPVIKLSNGLYTIVPFYTIVPTDSENLGTNLLANVLITPIKLLGTWSTDINTNHYEYDEEKNQWIYISAIK